MQRPTTEQVRERLRAICWPGFDQDIVAAGLVTQIEVRDGSAPSGFEVHTRRRDKADAREEGIRQVASAMIAAVADSIEREQTRHWELPGRVAGVEQRVNPSR